MPPSHPRYPPWPNRVAKLLAIVVFPLIWVGGLVTTYDAGMAVPDWPNTYNYNMFAYPMRDWFLGPWDLFVEHGHRQLGMLAGLIAIALCVVTLASDRRKWVVGWSVLILVLVICQGVLGGVRVLQDDRGIALVHGCLGPAFFATVVAMVAFTSKWWWQERDAVVELRRLSVDVASGSSILLVLATYVQLVFGANLRHIPEMADPAVYSLLLLAHLITAVLVLLLALANWYVSRVDTWASGGIRRTATVLALFVLLQIGLGVATYVVKFGWPSWLGGVRFAARYIIHEKTFLQVDTITLHVALGSLILATSTYLMIRILRAVDIARKKAFPASAAQPVA